MSYIRFAGHGPAVSDRRLEDKWAEAYKHHFSDWRALNPLVNISEDKDRFLIELAVPGYNKEDFSIKLDKNQLTVSVTVKPTEGEPHKYTTREFGLRNFSRAFTLPDSADTEKIVAEYLNGILQIGIQRKEESRNKPARAISVN